MCILPFYGNNHKKSDMRHMAMRAPSCASLSIYLSAQTSLYYIVYLQYSRNYHIVHCSLSAAKEWMH